MLITLVSSETTSDVSWVAIVLAAVQFVDNNFLMPLIVGNKVRINALVTIVGVVTGGALCGVSGMFLAIPGLAVMKVIFDRVEGLKPWGMILGDDTTGKKEKRETYCITYMLLPLCPPLHAIMYNPNRAPACVSL